VPSEHLIFYIGFDHRITDIVADEDADLAMPAGQQLGMDWRDIPGIPPDRLVVVGEAIDRCISSGGIHFCDFWADLPAGRRAYRLKVQRNAKQTHVVVQLIPLDRRCSHRRAENFGGGLPFLAELTPAQPSLASQRNRPLGGLEPSTATSL
jgi:hypothetical protein